MAESTYPSGSQERLAVHFDEYRDVYRDIFGLLGADKDSTHTLGRAVEVSQHWIAGDYGQDDALPVALNESQRQELRALCQEGLEMGPAWEALPGRHDTLVGFGASQFGNVRRSELVADLLRSSAHEFNRVVLIGGERPLYRSEVAGFRRLLQDEAVQQAALTDVWLKNVRDTFDAYFPEQGTNDNAPDQAYRLFGETTQIRVSMARVLAASALRDETVYQRTDGSIVGVKHFDVWPRDDSLPAEVTLLHCPPHSRKNGPPRHTTASAVADLVDVLGSEPDESVVSVGAQPHLRRMGMTVMRSYAQVGSSAVRVHMAGPGLDEHTPVEICVSEVAKTLYEVQQLQTVRS